MPPQMYVNSATSGTGIHVFIYRWVILFIFVLVSIINGMQVLQFSIIANIITKFYNVQSYWVDLATIIFFISYILFFYPIGFLIEKYSLKTTITVAAGLTVIGNILKLFAATPNRFWLILLAQFVISLGQVQLCSVPSKLATTWFGSEEVSTACAIAILGLQLGSALGCVQSPFTVTNSDADQVGSQLFAMFVYQAIATGCIFVLVLAFFRSRPELPPSQSQMSLMSSTNNMNSSSFLSDMTKIAKDKNFWYIVFSLGLANGVWNAFGVLVNSVYLHYFPNGESDAGLIALISIISGGCIGSMVFGILLDKTHHFKRVGFGILISSTITFALTVVTLRQKSRIGSFLTIPVFGFFITSVLIVGFEYLVEITYPIPEACSACAFNAAFYFLSIVATLLFEGLFDAIGYTWTFVVIFIILCVCSALILLVNSTLKRRDANLKSNGVVMNDNHLNVSDNYF